MTTLAPRADTPKRGQSMNNMKRNRILALLTVLLCMLTLLAGCGNDGGTGDTVSTEATYQITVADPIGTPYTTGVIVRIMKGEEQVAMQVVDENGMVTKTLEKGDYTVELMFTGNEEDYAYDKTGLTLSADKTELTITLTQTLTGEPTSLFASDKEYAAYHVSTGCYAVNLTAGERNYFLFTPTTSGTYEISAEGDVEGIGYYGSPYFVQSESVAEVEGNAFTISISADMIGTGNTGTTVMVIGIDAGAAESCILTIQRIGDPEWTLADEPWQVYMSTVDLAKYTMPAGVQVKEFDITASTDTYNLVYNEADGFYHLDSADGPLVLVRLGEDSKYLDSFQTIVNHSGVVKYFFGEDEEFQKKESYTECLMEYMEYMDEDYGVYPLTEDLKYIIQQRGDYVGWWDPDGAMYLFVDGAGNKRTDINTEIAWLFMCCYITEN